MVDNVPLLPFGIISLGLQKGFEPKKLLGVWWFDVVVKSLEWLIDCEFGDSAVIVEFVDIDGSLSLAFWFINWLY